MTDTILKMWGKFQRSLPGQISVPRSLRTHKEPISWIHYSISSLLEVNQSHCICAQFHKQLEKQEEWSQKGDPNHCRNRATKYWVIKTHRMVENTEDLNENQQRLNPVMSSEEIYRCHGRMQGEKPIYLPSRAKFTEELVKDAHIQSLHGGVGLTMARARDKYWVARLRQLAKRRIKSCNGCKRFHSKPYAIPPAGKLPQDRTEGHRPFQVIGINYSNSL